MIRGLGAFSGETCFHLIQRGVHQFLNPFQAALLSEFATKFRMIAVEHQELV